LADCVEEVGLWTELKPRHDGCSGVVETFGPYVASTGVVTGISFASFLRF
jgi:hypothetical protein